MSASTDVSEITQATSEIKIDGPTQPRPLPRPSAQTEAIAAERAAAGAPTVKTPTVETTTEELAAAPVAKEALFDDGIYLAVPTMDGQASDTLIIAFGGQIKYEASDETGKALFESLTLGKEVTLTVEAVVATKQGAYKEKADGEAVVTGKAGLKILDVYVQRPEDLV